MYITHRQHEVIELLGEGLSQPEIAKRLGVSARTAKQYCDTLRWKLNVKKARQIPHAYALTLNGATSPTTRISDATKKTSPGGAV